MSTLTSAQNGINYAFRRIFQAFGAEMLHAEKNKLCDLRNQVLRETEELHAEQLTACGSTLSDSHHKQWGTVTIKKALPERVLALVSNTGKQAEGWCE